MAPHQEQQAPAGTLSRKQQTEEFRAFANQIQNKLSANAKAAHKERDGQDVIDAAQGLLNLAPDASHVAQGPKKHTDEFRAFAKRIHNQLSANAKATHKARRDPDAMDAAQGLLALDPRRENLTSTDARDQPIVASNVRAEPLPNARPSHAATLQRAPGRLTRGPPPFTTLQFDHGYPVVLSNVRASLLSNPLHVQPTAPPGPTEPNFVFAHERDAYLAACPPDADFSKIIFLPYPPNGPPAPRHAAPTHPFSPSEAADIEALFLAKVRAARTLDNNDPETPSSPSLPATPRRSLPDDSSSPLSSPLSTPLLNRLLASSPPEMALVPRQESPDSDEDVEMEDDAGVVAGEQIPHIDPDDASVPEHYLACEVCRGIRRRAVPDEHPFWML